MEQLAMLNFLVGAVIVGCVGYAAINFISWFLSIFGGICIGC